MQPHATGGYLNDRVLTEPQWAAGSIFVWQTDTQSLCLDMLHRGPRLTRQLFQHFGFSTV